MDSSSLVGAAIETVKPRTQARLAGLLGVSPMAVSQWKRRGLPVDRCLQLERITGGAVTRHQMRPDVFGPAPGPWPAAGFGRTCRSTKATPGKCGPGDAPGRLAPPTAAPRWPAQIRLAALALHQRQVPARRICEFLCVPRPTLRAWLRRQG
jgi:hypothetical protein